MKLETLLALSKEELFALGKKENLDVRKATANFVMILSVIDESRWYREAGYSSLFDFCVEYYGQSKGTAHRNVTAARALKRSPQEIYDSLCDGSISVCSLIEVAGILTEGNATTVLGSLKGISKEQAQEVAASFGAPEKKKRECIRVRKVSVPKASTPDLFSAAPQSSSPVERMETEKSYTFSFGVSKDVKELYEEARRLVGPGCSIADVFERSLRALVQHRRPKARVVKKQSPVKEKKSRSRVIPRPVQRIVRERDREQCTYVSPDGKRCSAKSCLEFDHIELYCRGGAHEAGNLRLRCKAHNQLYAEQALGREFMSRFQKR